MRIKPLILPVVASTLVAAVALALGNSRGTPTQSPASVVARGRTARLTIANYAFAPRELTVQAGTTVTVKNTDATAHTATARSGAFDTGTLGPGQSVRLHLNAPGIYTYYCQFHAFMTGTIRVVAR